MKFIDIYRRIITYWGDTITFSDGVFLGQSSPNNLAANQVGDPSFYSKLLSRRWDDIEQLVGNTEPYEALMVWTLYQVFCKHASERFRQGSFEFTPHRIDKQEIERQYFANLQADDWETERLGYTRELE